MSADEAMRWVPCDEPPPTAERNKLYAIRYLNGPTSSPRYTEGDFYKGQWYIYDCSPSAKFKDPSHWRLLSEWLEYLPVRSPMWLANAETDLKKETGHERTSTPDQRAGRTPERVPETGTAALDRRPD